MPWNCWFEITDIYSQRESYLLLSQKAALNFTVGFPTVSSPDNKSFDTEMVAISLKAVMASCVQREDYFS